MSQKLPIELVILILSFDNVIRFRNGKFMNQLQISDEERKILNGIPRIIPIYTGHYLGRLVIFTCKVKLNNFHEIIILWNEKIKTYWWKIGSDDTMPLNLSTMRKIYHIR
jgi:hypothetical protein